jgi:hypothetical protein
MHLIVIIAAGVFGGLWLFTRWAEWRYARLERMVDHFLNPTAADSAPAAPAKPKVAPIPTPPRQWWEPGTTQQQKVWCLVRISGLILVPLFFFGWAAMQPATSPVWRHVKTPIEAASASAWAASHLIVDKTPDATASVRP